MTIQSSAPVHRAGSAPFGRRVPPTHVLALLQMLEDERAFRRSQLAQLAHEHPGGAVRQAVHDIIATGARRALDDIELALVRIGTDSYGECRACGTGIPSAVLDAVPWARLCPSCHRASER